MFNVMCERRGTEFGQEYVNILYDMVSRNLPEGLEGRFICYTDQLDELHPSIDVRPLDDPKEPGIFLRLDCCIVGPLDKIVERGLHWNDIEEYCPDGFTVGKKIILFPAKNPHECDGWVQEVWKIGGGTVADIVIVGPNICRETIVRNLVSADKRRDARWIKLEDAKEGDAVIIAGGPSLRDNLLSIALLQARGAKLFALNNVPAYLAQQEIYPEAHILLDGLPSVLPFVEGFQGRERYYASQCDPSVLDAAGEDLILWNAYIEGLLEVCPDAKDPFIGGGSTIGTRAMGLVHALGYRRIHLFGMDSCYQDGTSHCYEQPEYASSIDVRFEGKSYKAPAQLLAQIEEFKFTARSLMAFGCEIYVHGEGLLQAVAATMTRKVA